MPYSPFIHCGLLRFSTAKGAKMTFSHIKNSFSQCTLNESIDMFNQVRGIKSFLNFTTYYVIDIVIVKYVKTEKSESVKNSGTGLMPISTRSQWTLPNWTSMTLTKNIQSFWYFFDVVQFVVYIVTICLTKLRNRPKTKFTWSCKFKIISLPCLLSFCFAIIFKAQHSTSQHILRVNFESKDLAFYLKSQQRLIGRLFQVQQVNDS